MSIGPNGSSHMVSPGWSQDPTLQHLPPQGEGRQEHPSRDGIVMPSMVSKPILAFSCALYSSSMSGDSREREMVRLWAKDRTAIPGVRFEGEGDQF